MENKESVMKLLEEFSKGKKNRINRKLEDYLSYVARTGDLVFKWPLVKRLFSVKLDIVLTQFYESSSSDVPFCPNVDQFNYRRMKLKLLERLNQSSRTPFTIQRLSELLTNPRKEYNRVDKYMRAIEKCILVVSSHEPGNSKQSSKPSTSKRNTRKISVSCNTEHKSYNNFHCNDMSTIASDLGAERFKANGSLERFAEHESKYTFVDYIDLTSENIEVLSEITNLSNENVKGNDEKQEVFNRCDQSKEEVNQGLMGLETSTMSDIEDEGSNSGKQERPIARDPAKEEEAIVSEPGKKGVQEPIVIASLKGEECNVSEPYKEEEVILNETLKDEETNLNNHVGKEGHDVSGPEKEGSIVLTVLDTLSENERQKTSNAENSRSGGKEEPMDIDDS